MKPILAIALAIAAVWLDFIASSAGRDYEHAQMANCGPIPAYEDMEAVATFAKCLAGMDAEALHQFNLCEQAWPTYAYCPLDRGAWYVRHGQLDKAMAGYNRAEALDPQLFWPPYYRGLLRRQMGDVAGARRDLERSLELSPAYEPTQRALAELP